jgi:hypothetical protein
MIIMINPLNAILSHTIQKNLKIAVTRTDRER